MKPLLFSLPSCCATKRDRWCGHGKEKHLMLLKNTQLFPSFHSNYEIIILKCDCWPLKVSAKYPSTLHWVPGVAARRTINLEISKPWNSASRLSNPKHHKTLPYKNLCARGGKEFNPHFRQMYKLRSTKITLKVSLLVSSATCRGQAAELISEKSRVPGVSSHLMNS